MKTSVLFGALLLVVRGSKKDEIENKQLGDVSVSNPSPDQISFYYVDRTNLNEPTLMTPDNILSLTNTPRLIRYLIHGWLEDSTAPWYKSLTDALLQKNDHQIVLVDWGVPASWKYPNAAQASKTIGNFVAEHIMSTTAPFFNIHIIGHSMGAQIAGFAGKQIQQLNGGFKIGRITGLDPSGPLFLSGFNNYLNGVNNHLNKEDAEFVDITHTDSRTFGQGSAEGTVDFYVNGGFSQPGCGFYPVWNILEVDRDSSPSIFCSHRRSCAYFIESINSREFLAAPCNSYLSLLTVGCGNSTTITYGDDVDRTARGVYYFRTNWNSPYATNAFP